MCGNSSETALGQSFFNLLRVPRVERAAKTPAAKEQAVGVELQPALGYFSRRLEVAEDRVRGSEPLSDAEVLRIAIPRGFKGMDRFLPPPNAQQEEPFHRDVAERRRLH